ncbi:MAG: hypothetical protein ACYC64_20200, partial [Armatimonadota bacterium]
MSQNWKTFLANHMDSTWSMDFAVVPTLTFRLLYVFIIVSHERRKIVHFGVTGHPTMLWAINQLRSATMDGTQPKYLIRDNDRIYGGGVPTFLRNCHIEEVRTAYHSPWQTYPASMMFRVLSIVDIFIESQQLKRVICPGKNTGFLCGFSQKSGLRAGHYTPVCRK